MTLDGPWFNNNWIREAIGLPPPKECKADKEIAALEAERDRLRAALEWYSKELPMSSGDIAREVLAGKMPEELARRALKERS